VWGTSFAIFVTWLSRTLLTQKRAARASK
jgi:hypothetical protein